jgi:16S rRNA (guanine1207-N2)-methyltransferase
MDGRERVTIGGELGGRLVEVVSRPGFPGWGEISRAEMLLASYAEIGAGERVLVHPCGHGALGLWAVEATSASEVLMSDTNVLAAEAAEATCARHRCGPRARVAVGLPSGAGQNLDVALLRAPKGRDLARLLFLETFSALRPGGRMLLAGANREGIKSLDKDAAALFGPGRLLGYKGGNRAFLYVRPERPPEPLPAEYLVPGVPRDTWHEYTVGAGGDALVIHTRPGVFSWRELDAGTRALLEALPVRATDRVLDIGAGAGVIGLSAARRARQGHATLVDVDWLAHASAEENIRVNGIANAEAILGDGVRAVADRRFTLVASNPPFHSGHATSREAAEAFIREARQVLEPGGALVLVANRFLPYDRLMADTFGQSEVLVGTPQYWVLMARK